MEVIGANDSNVQVRTESKIYTGLNNFLIVALNPSLKTVQEKINPNATEKSVIYTGVNNDGHNWIRLDFYLNSKDGKIKYKKISFFLSNVEQKSKGGKPKWIDKLGNTTYKDTLEEAQSEALDWMDGESFRACYNGEEDLTSFFRAWLNFDIKAEGAAISIGDVSKIVKGDAKGLKSFKDLIKSREKNEIKLLALARNVNGKIYQDFYMGFFGVPYLKKSEPWIKAIENEYRGLKSEQLLEDGLNFVEYIGSTDVGHGASNPTGGAEGNTGGFEDDVL